jgi:hypothetical protein
MRFVSDPFLDSPAAPSVYVMGIEEWARYGEKLPSFATNSHKI